MSTTTVSTITYPSPPPTTNTLDSRQRMRLIRSARKLEAVMGTTPYLLEQDSPITLLPISGDKLSKKLRRQGSIFTPSHVHFPSVSSLTSSSTTSLHSHNPSLVSLPLSMHSTDSLLSSPHRPQPARGRRSPDKSTQQLYLRVNTVPLSQADQRCCTSLPSTPGSSCSSLFSFPPTPPTPTFDPAEVRRKRILKLARHLGETIPPDLVAVQRPSEHYLMPSDERPVRPSSPNPTLYCHARTGSDWVGEWNRPNMGAVREELRALKAKLPSRF